MAAAPTNAGLSIGTAPAAAMDLTYLAMATSLGLAMGNATHAQQRGQAIAQTALTQALALIIAFGTKPKP